ncbi:hypothetical protein ACWDR9_36095, partial [Streptosporangium sandarakinum]
FGQQVVAQRTLLTYLPKDVTVPRTKIAMVLPAAHALSAVPCARRGSVNAVPCAQRSSVRSSCAPSARVYS